MENMKCLMIIIVMVIMIKRGDKEELACRGGEVKNTERERRKVK